MALSGVRTRRWTRVEYDRMIEQGLFRPGERLELVDGALVVREPQGTPHATGVRMGEDALRSAFGPGWEVRGQLPVALDDASEPEPDLAVVPGTFRDYRHAHPRQPVLVVELADTSLAFDRREKASLYARGGIRDYWIVNLVDGALEVFREPVRAPEETAPFGWQYEQTRRLGRTEFVSPLARPGAQIAVADLIP